MASAGAGKASLFKYFYSPWAREGQRGRAGLEVSSGGRGLPAETREGHGPLKMMPPPPLAALVLLVVGVAGQERGVSLRPRDDGDAYPWASRRHPAPYPYPPTTSPPVYTPGTPLPGPRLRLLPPHPPPSPPP
nr:WW domain-binding protein 11-like [Penaeus vannamei]